MSAHDNNPMKRTATPCNWCGTHGTHNIKTGAAHGTPHNDKPPTNTQSSDSNRTRDEPRQHPPRRHVLLKTHTEREAVTCCSEPTTTTQTESFLPKVPTATERTAGIRNGSQGNMPRSQKQSPQDTDLQSLRWNRICQSRVQPNNTKQRRKLHH